MSTLHWFSKITRRSPCFLIIVAKSLVTELKNTFQGFFFFFFLKVMINFEQKIIKMRNLYSCLFHKDCRPIIEICKFQKDVRRGYRRKRYKPGL